MVTRRGALFGLIALLAACSRAEPTLEVPSADEYAVWSAAVDSLFGARHLRLVVRERTMAWNDLPRAYFASPRPDPELLALRDHYIVRNRHPARLRPGEFRVGGVRLVPDFPDVLGSTADLVFDGRLMVSRVGFDRGGSRALVTVNYNCGDLCGEGSLLVMERGPDGRWRVTATLASPTA